jgi:hypothetical protein
MAPMNSLVVLNALDPLRPVDWRYQAALQRVARGLSFPRTIWDTATLEAAIYLGRAARRYDPGRLAAEFPGLHLAYGIYRDPDPGLRFALEARLLVGGEAAEVTAMLGTDAGVVAAYQGAFFDVGDWLGRVDFIMQRVINPQGRAEYQYRDSGWKLIAYLGGAEALNRFLSPPCGTELEGVEREGIALALAGRMRWLVEQGKDLDPRLIADWPKIVGFFGKDGPRTDYERNVEAMLMGIPIEILTMEAAKADPDLQKCYELRPKDQMLRAAGLLIPGIEQYEELEHKLTRGRRDDPTAPAPDPPHVEQPQFEDPWH